MSSKKDATPSYQRACAGAWSRSTRLLSRSTHEIRVVRGSFEVTATVFASGKANVTSSTIIGLTPPGSVPIFVRTLVGTRAIPSIENVSGAMA
jgi:hypothetical protein